MTMPFETLTILPDFAGNRFGQAQLGADRVNVLRAEHSLLLDVVGALAGKDAATVTRDDVVHLQARLRFHATFPSVDRQRSMHQAVKLLSDAILLNADHTDRRDLARDAALWTLAAGRP